MTTQPSTFAAECAADAHSLNEALAIKASKQPQQQSSPTLIKFLAGESISGLKVPDMCKLLEDCRQQILRLIGRAPSPDTGTALARLESELAAARAVTNRSAATSSTPAAPAIEAPASTVTAAQFSPPVVTMTRAEFDKLTPADKSRFCHSPNHKLVS